MKSLSEELEVNFGSFNDNLKSKLSESFTVLEGNNNLYAESYKRISSLESWKAFVLENKLPSAALSFYIESQNDLLLSHSLAKIGSWRPALQSLRSAIENVLFCLYYKDHPVEYQLWEIGKHLLPISDYMNYLSKHPSFSPVEDNISGLELLKREYPTLSKAVHSSSVRFRMTHIDGRHFPAIMLPEVPKLNQWSTREIRTIETINLMLITMFHQELQGAKLRNLRKSISFSISQNMHDKILSTFSVHLFPYPVDP